MTIALMDILKEENLQPEQISDWIEACGLTLVSEISPLAVFVNRKAMAKAKTSDAILGYGDAYDPLEGALDLLKTYFYGFDRLGGLFAQKNKDFEEEDDSFEDFENKDSSNCPPVGDSDLMTLPDKWSLYGLLPSFTSKVTERNPPNA